MKKSLLFAGLGALMLMTSSRPETPGIAIGSTAPALTVDTAAGATADLATLRGKYVVLTFWSSTDAASRVACNHYDALVGRAAATPTPAGTSLSHLAVNLDASEALFAELVRHDGLDAATQGHASGADATSIKARFGLEQGLGSYLIDPSGRIAAVNPTDAQLKAFIG